MKRDTRFSYPGINSYRMGDLEVGMVTTLTTSVKHTDISGFVRKTGDNNPLHSDTEYAKHSMFNGEIAPGGLLDEILSKIFGNQIPGQGAVYLEKNVRYMHPVRAGDTLETKMEITKRDYGKRKIWLEGNTINQNGTIVGIYKATLMLDSFQEKLEDHPRKK